jgi:hypothetical protein
MNPAWFRIRACMAEAKTALESLLADPTVTDRPHVERWLQRVSRVVTELHDEARRR